VTTIRAAEASDIAEVRVLFREYAESLGIDLGFQGFEDELATLPGPYSLPRGCLLLAVLSDYSAGCVAVRPLEVDVCEMKRLYVRPQMRGQATGRILAEAAVAFGRGAGYKAMRLDTLPTMVAARSLYRELGFQNIQPYRYNPVPGAMFMELMLDIHST